MNLKKLLLVVLASFLAVSAQAAGLLLSDDECVELLEKHATDPGSVPQHLLDDCNERLAASGVPQIAPAAGTAALAGTDPSAATDPCAGPNAASSVFCWGPWAALAPAAAGNPLPDTTLDIPDDELRPELAAQFDNAAVPDPAPPIDPPMGGCAPGAPCGFATVVAGATSNAPADDTQFARFDLATDGSQFVVNPGEPGEIASVTGMNVSYTQRPDQYDGMRAVGADGDQQSRLLARVIRNNGEITAAADVWTNGDAGTGVIQSGYFAWGRASSQADLDALNGGSVTRSLSFSGPMSVDNGTAAAIQVDFGPQTGWSGSWTNPAWAFDAGGTVSGADLVSAPDQFSGNVLPGSVVQGALMGTEGNRSLAHIIDVSLEQAGLIRDVGLLQENTATAVP